ncbi:MAG: hypothetical protein P0Y59_10805 [Candidatus Sphingomonas phytovorans]|nr:hypothetical protein [Sphingomonas sp.]WEK02136.1 MAG: hypothetical protein P0Y59_10805 [Sphingomonas sp.]
MTDHDSPRSFRRLASGLTAALCLLSGAAHAGQPRTIAPGAAPQAWLAYAQTVSDAVHTRLTGDDPAAVRLRDYMNQLPGGADAEGAALRIAFWIDGKGRITRIDHALFAQTQPNDDLQTLLVGIELPAPPPKGMLLPLRLGVQIKLKPRPEPMSAFTTISLRYRNMPPSPRWS